ncbi:MAG: RimJ/RimL family protein N-acetyltransferase [Motiliproteus sp.]|jgi:RimJ/RimL family protein N-acetyltransferase
MKKRVNNLGQEIGAELKQWTTRRKPAPVCMRGQYCRVTPCVLEEHAESLYRAFSEDAQAHNWTYLPYGPFHDLSAFKDWLSTYCSTTDPLFYAVIDTKTSTAIGLASFLRIEPSVGVIEVGHIHFSPRLQRTPLATEAMYLMMKHVFEDLGYRRYEWKCDACNQGSKLAAARLGFSFEGVFRQATIYKERNRDTAWFAILDSDWPRQKAAFERWLQRDNFDGQGLQKRRLQACMN